MPLSHFVPAYPSPSPCPQVDSLRLCLYSCPAHLYFRKFTLAPVRDLDWSCSEGRMGRPMKRLWSVVCTNRCDWSPLSLHSSYVWLFSSSHQGVESVSPLLTSCWPCDLLCLWNGVEVTVCSSLGLKKPGMPSWNLSQRLCEWGQADLLEDGQPCGAERSYPSWGHPRPAGPQPNLPAYCRCMGEPCREPPSWAQLKYCWPTGLWDR